MTFNGDSGSNYSRTRLYGNGSTATTNSSNSGTQLSFTTGTGNAQSTFIINIMNYSNASTYKTVITRASMDIPSMSTGIWMSTAAITSINLTANSSGQFVAGTTITLYGIKAA
jgi:hypothetical protein